MYDKRASSGWALRTWAGWGLVALGSLSLVLLSVKYLTLDPEVYFERQRAVYEAHEIGLIGHIAFMLIAAVFGPFQFLRPLRERFPKIHRMSGRVYIASALAGAAGGLYMSQYSASGAVSGWGFALLGIGVLVTTGRGFYLVINARYQEHSEWMLRSYALIFGAVTLRMYLAPLEAAFGEDAGYATVAWLSWVPNLLFAEWLVRRGRVRRHLAPAPRVSA